MTLLIDVKNTKDKRIFMDIAKHLGLASRLISADEMEDIGLANAMKKSKKGEVVSEEKIIKALAKWK